MHPTGSHLRQDDLVVWSPFYTQHRLVYVNRHHRQDHRVSHHLEGYSMTQMCSQLQNWLHPVIRPFSVGIDPVLVLYSHLNILVLLHVARLIVL